MPQVSIGMPVYNGERFMRQAIDSVLGQTFADFELIISDNASTDDTEKICRAYARRDPRIRYFRNETNIGAARNFNRVFRLSSGEYYKLANADDACAPDLVASCAGVLDRYPEVVLAYAQTTLIDERDTVICEYDDGLDLRSTDVTERFRAAMHGVKLVNVFQGLLRSSAMRKTRLMGSYCASDVLLLEELALYGQFWEIPRRLFFRRLHSRAASSIRSPVTRMQFIDPSIKDDAMILWRHQFERVASIVRAPLAPGEKAVLIGIVLRFAIANRCSLLGELANWAKGTARRWSRLPLLSRGEIPQGRS